MIHASAIDHVCLAVSSLRQSKTYYERVLGATCQYRDNDPTTLFVETPQIHFFLSESEASSDFLAQQHLSFHVEALDEAIAALEQLGICDYQTGVVTFFTHRNYRWCEWRDPDGIRLECIEILPDT